MPYIADYSRRSLLNTGQKARNVGELTYQLTRMCTEYLQPHITIHFQNYAEVLGALEATKLELYRRMVAPYEDKKIEENGDVY